MSVQDLIDSSAGAIVATVLHTVGAIMFLAGIVLYLVWAHHLRGPRHDKTTGRPAGRATGEHRPDLLLLGGFLTASGAVAFLLGGFIRTWESAHPSLFDALHEPWATVMVVKHVFLFIGIGAAWILFGRVAPRLLEDHEAARAAGYPTASRDNDHRFATGVVLASIILASLLGAVGQVLPVGQDEPHTDGDVPPQIINHTASGSLTSTPLAPRSHTGTFDVPNGTTTLEAVLGWQPEQFALQLTLVDPDGTATVAGGTPQEATVEAPLHGTWTYRITSGLAVDAQWELTVRMHVGGHDHGTFIADTATIPAGTFFEINTEMPANGTFWWEWSASATVHFDVHSHFDDEVQYHVEMDAATHRGSFTNDREGGYSLLWENQGAAAVTLHYRVWGDFEVDSYFP